MKLEDPTETWDFFNKSAGESLVTQVESFQSNSGSISNAYQDTKGARVEKRSRIDLQDLKEQDVGEAHMFFKSRITRYRSFYASPKGSKAMRLNQFLKIELPKDNDLYTLVKGIEDFESLARNISGKSLQSTLSLGLSKLLSIHDSESSELTSIDKGLNSFIKFHDLEESGEVEFSEVSETHSKDSDTGVTIFNRLTIPDYLKEFIITEKFNSDALLGRKILDSSLTYLFRLMGVDDSEAGTTTEDVIGDIARVTGYSKNTIGKIPDVTAIITKINSFNEDIPLNTN